MAQKMKTDKIILGLLLLGATALAGCEESLPERFGAIDGVYFNNREANNSHTDKGVYTFIYEDKDYMEIPVRVQLVGRAAQEPRPVNIRVSSADAAPGTDYQTAGEAVLPADATWFDYIITLKRTEALKAEFRNLVVEIGPNEHFIIPFTQMEQSGGEPTSVIRYTINFSDQFTAPPLGWRDMFIGEFTQQKFELICDVMQMPRADFNEKGKIPDAKWMFIQSRMVTYVKEQQDLKNAGMDYDQRAFDEKGNPLKFY